MADNGEGRFGRWRSSGALATAAWFTLLIVYVTFRALGIEDPMLVNAFQLLTGSYVSVLMGGFATKNKSGKSNGNSDE